ncbi:uncharacterized protein HD556DRAFT_1302793 [Suillus plorans]|uniref:Uncharacterized protein n=1 Tax=Suillus plorans TaxID=116603 RepID=A0A9P7J782_9AGAM|nr:uncharacterized protein HD556DRAFT_1302793 [Suillus plorans]KAG1806273.1 hypothetical protein HD556DRAFT_1302793 [Suillus plorans]
MNSLTFLEVYLGLRVCTMARGKVVGDSENIPAECMPSPGKVLLLVLWRDTEPEATCPTPSQVHSLEVKLKRSPGWWVEVPNQSLHRVNGHRAKCLFVRVPSTPGLFLNQDAPPGPLLRSSRLVDALGLFSVHRRAVQTGSTLEETVAVSNII